jgi:molybdopterin/thiamine biosynthesis adenylyltransferase
LCGRIVLADFDQLELSNLNRLTGGVDDLGGNKAHLAARRISKIDPFLEIVVCDEGISRDNAFSFLGELDLLIDECDDLQLKYYLREFSRERRLNLVFAADERGMLSVEPYAHAPDLLPFHGRIPGPPPPRQSFGSPKEFMRSLTEWLGGWEQISVLVQGSWLRPAFAVLFRHHSTR